MKPNEGDMLVTPKKFQKLNNDLSTKNNRKLGTVQISHDNNSESPFIQIGTKIKSIFGNFFKTQDKLNKSYEESNRIENSESYSTQNEGKNFYLQGAQDTKYK